MARILTAREQVELLSPWLIEARGRLSDQLDVDQLTQNLLDHWNMASDENKIDGMNWYPAAREWLKWKGAQTGHSYMKNAAILASLSPERRFNKATEPTTFPAGSTGEEMEGSNVGDALRFFHHYAEHGQDDPNWLGWGTLGRSYNAVMRIHQAADDPQSILAAMGKGTPKTSNFFRTFMGDDDAPVIDTWMGRGILAPGGNMVSRAEAQKWLNRRGTYGKMEQAVRNAAKQMGVSPAVMQATVWSKLNNSHYNEPDRPELHHPLQLFSIPSEPVQQYKSPRRNQVASKYHHAIPEHLDRKWKNDVMKAVEESGWQGLTLRHRPGDAPQHGYMVSIPGHEEKHPMADLSGATLGDYGERKREVINSDPANYLGGWQEAPWWYNDISRNYQDLWHADKDAFQGHQKALYDIDRDRGIDTDEAGWMTGAPWITGGRR